MKQAVVQILLFTSIAAVSACSVKRASTSIKRQTESFIEIEADSNNAWFGCFEINPEDHLSLMNFYVKDGTTTHQFLYRRLFPTKECVADLKRYTKIREGARRLTVVGITTIYKPEDTEEKIEAVPEAFATGHKKIANWTFIRLETEKGCEAYFSNHCKPENYWGGLIPQE